MGKAGILASGAMVVALVSGPANAENLCKIGDHTLSQVRKIIEQTCDTSLLVEEAELDQSCKGLYAEFQDAERKMKECLETMTRETRLDIHQAYYREMSEKLRRAYWTLFQLEELPNKEQSIQEARNSVANMQASVDRVEKRIEKIKAGLL